MPTPSSEEPMVAADVPVAATIPRAESYRASRFERLAMVGLAALAVGYVAFVVIRMLPARATGWDFSHYYASAMVLRDGGDPYSTDLRPIGARLGLQIGEINRGSYPPTFIWSFAPLTRLPVRRAFFVWESLNVACLVAGLFLVMRETVSCHAASWLSLGVVFFAPVLQHMVFGQSQLMIFLMLVLVIRALERSRDAEAGVILAAAALLRAYPLAMAGYLIVRRHWKALAWMAAGLAVGGAITVAAVGFKTFLDFRYMPAFVTQRSFLEDSHQIALGSFISRMFWRLTDSGLIGSHESLRAAVSLAVCMALGIFVMVSTWMHDSNRDEPDTDRRAYSWWIATMILISPTSWDHYLVLLLLPFIQITSAALAGRVGRPAVITCIASYVLAEISFGMNVWSQSVPVLARSLLTTEMGFVAAATAWVGIALFAGTPATVTAALPNRATIG